LSNHFHLPSKPPPSGLHIGSIFILLGVSALGSFVPIAVSLSKHPWVVYAVKFGTFFGIGTILATAFIHMLTPAAEKLGSECLPESWVEGYESWPYLFALIAIVLMQLIDYLIEGAFRVWQTTDDLVHLHQQDTVLTVHSSQHTLSHARTVEDAETGSAHDHGVDEEEEEEEQREHGHNHSNDNEGHKQGSNSDEEDHCKVHGHGCHHLLAATSKDGAKRDPSAIVGIYLMEAGILMHSLLIGIALGVATGTEFDTLLIALSFHQLFEGFAISAAAIETGMRATKALLLAALYSITTPIGIAIGIGIRSTYNENSQTALYVEGVFDSLSAGILIYIGLVELLSPLMTQSKWMREQRWFTQAFGFFSFYCGIIVMVVIGKWA
jgi:solute carrier family 39 (zinc transporter), member 1/2/3